MQLRKILPRPVIIVMMLVPIALVMFSPFENRISFVALILLVFFVLVDVNLNALMSLKEPHTQRHSSPSVQRCAADTARAN